VVKGWQDASNGAAWGRGGASCSPFVFLPSQQLNCLRGLPSCQLVVLLQPLSILACSDLIDAAIRFAI
jgi:hypothetical protein